MMRGLLIGVFLIVLYYALKAVFQSAVRGYHNGERSRSTGTGMGEEMLLDPECRTYVPKGRTVTRRIGDKLCSFCSEACADRYEAKHRV